MLRITTEAGDVLDAGSVLSTVPVSLLARLAGAPDAVTAAAGRLRHRAMVLVYLVLAKEQLTPYDAHYFPELCTPVSRMSEPKNFRDGGDGDDQGVTVVCAEVPCWEGDVTWTASPDELRDRVVTTLEPLGFHFDAVQHVEVRRIPRCYPVYTGSYAADLAAIEAWAAPQPRLLTFGRQGLFAPDNTHHALVMGRRASEVLRPDGTFDRRRWADARDSFRGAHRRGLRSSPRWCCPGAVARLEFVVRAPPGRGPSTPESRSTVSGGEHVWADGAKAG